MSSKSGKGKKAAAAASSAPASSASAGATAAAAAAAAAGGEEVVPKSQRLTRPGLIANKAKRARVTKLYKKAHNEERKAARKERKRLQEELGDDAPKAKMQRTIENTREYDETVVDPDDEEVAYDEATDELSDYFDGREPKVLVTTSNRPVGETWKFAEHLINIVPSAEFVPRQGFEMKTIIKQAVDRGFTDLIVINEDRKQPNTMLMCHLPNGPTLQFKLTSIQYPKDIKGHGKQTFHYPEIIVNNFHTRLGHVVGRFLTSLFPQKAEFQGRSCVTWACQRDFIFFRYHRYIFKSGKRVGLQELGPRFTLKLQYVMKGTFDTKEGEYEWKLKRHEMETSRRRFFL